MRPIHVMGGLVLFGAGVFLFYTNILYVVEFIKGGTQPLLIIIGLAAAAAAIFRPAQIARTKSVTVAVVALGIGAFGVYDEFYVTIDFLHGMLPVFLLVAGLLTVIHGIDELKK